jgi:uncharacterized protein YndB with AHSA1/START domain
MGVTSPCRARPRRGQPSGVATNRRLMPVPPDSVWDVLADPDSYAYWVVGSKAVRAADPGFPAAGTRFHHTVGVGPLQVRDHTEVIEAAPPRLLHLRAKARPLGTASVVLKLEPHSEGTRVELVERPDGIYSVLALNPLLQLATKMRNAEALARLESLAILRHAER